MEVCLLPTKDRRYSQSNRLGRLASICHIDLSHESIADTCDASEEAGAETLSEPS